MATGTVTFYDINKGFGFISRDGAEDVYVNEIDLTGHGFRCLVAGETVEFEVIEQRTGKPRAKGVKPIAGRLRGKISGFDHRKGFGRIKPDSGGEEVFLHHSAILGDGVATAIQGENVEYEVILEEKGPSAIKVKRCDPRLPLFRFAEMGVAEDWLDELARLAQREPGDWNFHRKREQREEDGNAPFRPVLKSYIIYTFARLEEEEKIAFGDDGRGKYACFNTGLVTEMQEEIYTLLEQNRKGRAAKAPWGLVGFFARSDRQLLSRIGKLPPLANYFDDPSILLYDRRRELHMDIPHIIKDNLHRFPPICRDNEYLAGQLLESARAVTQQRVYRNYKTAIPQFYRGEIQLLLPLCLERPNQADLALVVSRVGEQYRGDTVLTLDMAYNNARLITRPDNEWLTP